MDSIKGLNQIAEILRQKMAERGSNLSKSSSRADASPSASRSQTAARPDTDEIKRRIGERIRSLQDDEKKDTKGAQVFVETVMTWEFGEHLLNDPQFTDLSNEVVKSIAENPAAWKKMQALLAELGRSV